MKRSWREIRWQYSMALLLGVSAPAFVVLVMVLVCVLFGDGPH